MVRTSAKDFYHQLAKCKANHELVPIDSPQNRQPLKNQVIRQSVYKFINQRKFYPELRFIIIKMILLRLWNNLLHPMLRVTVTLPVYQLLIMLTLQRLIRWHFMMILHSTRLRIITGIEFCDACTFNSNWYNCTHFKSQSRKFLKNKT